MRIKKEKHFDIKQWVTWTLRKSSLRMPARSAAVRAARTAQKVNPATGRLCWHVACASCKQEILEKLCKVDHVDPMIPITGWTKWNATDMWDFTPIIYRLIEGKLQILCKPCHDEKSNLENALRRAHEILTTTYRRS